MAKGVLNGLVGNSDLFTCFSDLEGLYKLQGDVKESGGVKHPKELLAALEEMGTVVLYLYDTAKACDGAIKDLETLESYVPVFSDPDLLSAHVTENCATNFIDIGEDIVNI